MGKYIKSNGLVKASYKLSVAEQRVVIIALMKAGREPITDQMMYEVSASDLISFTSQSSQAAYQTLVEAAQKLKSRRVVFFENPDGKKVHKVDASWVQTIRYIENSGSILLRFNADMIPYINQLTKRFTIVYLTAGKNNLPLDFNSSYSYRFIELMSQWVDVGLFEISPQDLRICFGISDKYEKFTELRRRVIDIAVNEINAKSDWQLQYRTKRRGRVIDKIIFSFVPPEEIIKARKKTKASVNKAQMNEGARPGEDAKGAYYRLKKIKQELREWKSA